MKVLSIKQPWLDAILYGGKRVENRGWTTSYRGPIALHASLRPDTTEPPVGTPLHHYLNTAVRMDALLPTPLGAIAGSATAVDSHPAHPDCGCDVWGEQTPGRCHLVLEDVRVLQHPYPWKGTLGLRDLPADVERIVQTRAILLR